MDPQKRKRAILNTSTDTNGSLESPMKRANKNTFDVDIKQETNKQLNSNDNDDLAAELSALKREYVELEKRYNASKTIQERYDTALSILNRTWSNFTDDLQLLLARLDTSTYAQYKERQQDSNNNNSADGDVSIISYPFLQRLLQAGSAVIKPDDAKNVEKLLGVRYDATKDIIAKIVNAILEEKQKNEEISRKIQDGKDPLLKREAVLHSLKSENARLSKRAEELQVMLDDLHVQHRATKTECDAMKDELLRYKQRVEELAGDLDETKFDLKRDKKQIDKYKKLYEQLKQQQAAAPLAQSSTAAAQPANGKKPENMVDSSVVNDLKAQLEEAQALAEARLKECDAERQKLVELTKELNKERLERDSDERVKSSPAFKYLQANVATLTSELHQLRARLDEEKKKAAEELATAKQERDKLEEAFENTKKLLESLLKEKEDVIAKLRTERDEIQLKTEIRNGTLGDVQTAEQQQKRIKELNLLVQAQQKELSKKASGSSTNAAALEKQVQDLTKEVEMLRKLQASTNSGSESNPEVEQLKMRITQLEEELTAARQESEALLSEMENVNSAYADMQEQNARLALQLSEKDDSNLQLITERIKAQQSQNLLAQEKEALKAKIAAGEEVIAAQNEAIKKLNEKSRKDRDLLEAKANEFRALKGYAETYRREIMDLRVQCNELRAKAEHTKAAMDQAAKTADETAEQLHNERAKLHRLQEKYEATKKKLERTQASLNEANAIGGAGGKGADPLRIENQELKRQLRCSVCDDRRKSCIITKCFHTFCKECIAANIQVRSRKCPTCGEKFGEKDVRDFYL